MWLYYNLMVKLWIAHLPAPQNWPWPLWLHFLCYVICDLQFPWSMCGPRHMYCIMKIQWPQLRFIRHFWHLKCKCISFYFVTRAGLWVRPFVFSFYRISLPKFPDFEKSKCGWVLLIFNPNFASAGIRQPWLHSQSPCWMAQRAYAEKGNYQLAATAAALWRSKMGQEPGSSNQDCCSNRPHRKQGSYHPLPTHCLWWLPGTLQFHTQRLFMFGFHRFFTHC